MQITPHFKLEEFTSIDQYQLKSSVIRNISWLCKLYLEPLREDFGPIIINSGYRTPEKNKAVGGAANSYHLYGLAADIRCSSCEDAIKKAAKLLYCDLLNEEDNKLAELFICQNKFGSWWVHVALRRYLNDNKHAVDFMTY